jgi:hypothetical protein
MGPKTSLLKRISILLYTLGGVEKAVWLMGLMGLREKSSNI